MKDLVSTINPDSENLSSLSNGYLIIRVGEWYWVLPEDDDDERWLACAMECGSNFVELSGPTISRFTKATRIHLAEASVRLLHEPNADLVIRGEIERHQRESQNHLSEVKRITSLLGVSPDRALPNKSATSNELVVFSGQTNIKEYERQLVVAKKETLPDLFEKIKAANAALAGWMTAELLPMQASVDSMDGAIEQINDRIFNVSLYAGLTETVIRFFDGSPASFHEKLHVMQRKLYMDEEFIANYRTGGMEFKDIDAFDQWVAEPENRDRLLPFPRCLLAMQVRRKDKDREWEGDIRSLLRIGELNRLDKMTFLIIRNGEQLYRLSTDLDFGDLIFPDKSMFNPSEPTMVKMWGRDKIDKMITVADYEQRCAQQAKQKADYQKWEEENPESTWDSRNGYYGFANPHRSSFDFSPNEWHLLDQDFLYFDECMKEIDDRIKKYNRISLIIQGLFDRTEILHPHPPVKTWTASGFDAAIELIFDGSNTLTYGEAPDFEAYRDRCNASLKTGSHAVGQDAFWEIKEAEKECARIDSDHRNRSSYRPKTYRPYGNPGPGIVSEIADWKPRTKQAVFRWTRERITYDAFSDNSRIPCTLTVPQEHLFNVDAYQPGDFRQFFCDPRTRQDYLKWAPLLLSAEEFHAGNLTLDA